MNDLYLQPTSRLIAIALTTALGADSNVPRELDRGVASLIVSAGFEDERSSGDAGWQAISTLQTRGTRVVFEICCALCQSNNANERRVGVDILGQLGWQDDCPFRE